MGHEWERTDSNRAADQSCSSSASAAACTEVISTLETSTEQECCYHGLSLSHYDTLRNSFAF